MSQLPPYKELQARRAVRLEWFSIVMTSCIVVAMYLVMGSSQAMKVAWVDNALALVPAIAILAAQRVRHRPRSERFPYGFDRAISVAFLCAACALLAMGGFMLFDSLMQLVSRTRPSIGTVELLGRRFWLGWLMIAVLVATAVPPFVVGKLKQRVARRLHDKALRADAEMNSADWRSQLVAAAGVLGVGLGLWWADAVFAALIAATIAADGWKNLTSVVRDMLDQRPLPMKEFDDPDGIPERMRGALLHLPWVADAEVRLRDYGHHVVGEAFVVPADEGSPLERIAEARRVGGRVDWRVGEIVVTLVSEVPRYPAPTRAASEPPRPDA